MLRKAKLLLLIFLETARVTVQITWNTASLSYNTCPGKNQLLMWNFTKEMNEKIMELQWFFNGTTLICLESKTIGFHLETCYNGRVERTGTAGILLKNISFNDTGQYSLYVKLAGEKIRHIQHIFLTVDAEVSYQCKPMIEIHNQNALYCSTTCFIRSHLSSEWIINDTNHQVGIGPYLNISEGINEHVLCCLSGLKCLDDEKKSCVPNPFPSKTVTGYVHTNGHTDVNSIKATNYQTINMKVIILITVPAIFLLLVVLIIAAYCLWRKQMSADGKPTNSHSAKTCSDTSEVVSISNGAKALVRPSYSHNEMECADFFKGANISAASKDQLPNRSNSSQNIQIVNNIRVDGDFMRQLMTEAAREESSKLKFHLPSDTHEEKWNTSQSDKSVEMTVLDSLHHHHSDADTSDTSSDYEDAVSEPLMLDPTRHESLSV